MTSLGRLGFTSAACFTLCTCGQASPVDPAANDLEEVPANVVVGTDSAVPQPTLRREVDRAATGRTPSKEPRMSQPDPSPSSPPLGPSREPPVKAPTEQPRRVILPSPVQPPAEVDPVQPYPGDKVPR